MGRGLQGALLRSFGGRDHEATVLEVSRVAPHCVRITMSSPTIFEDVVVEPTAFLRFWFPDPEGSDSEFQRIYTIVWAEPESGRFAVDVVLHEPSGPASHWAARAEPGMTLPVVCAGFSRVRGSRGVACRASCSSATRRPYRPSTRSLPCFRPTSMSRCTSNGTPPTTNSSRSPTIRAGDCTGWTGPTSSPWPRPSRIGTGRTGTHGRARRPGSLKLLRKRLRDVIRIPEEPTCMRRRIGRRAAKWAAAATARTHPPRSTTARRRRRRRSA